MAKTYIISNASPQSGKTTTAFNLALCFAAMGKKTLLIDCGLNSWVNGLLNPQKSSSINYVSPFLSFLCSQDVNPEDTDAFQYVLMDVGMNKLADMTQKFSSKAKLIVPVEAEYYGLNTLKSFFDAISGSNMPIEGLIPVMHRLGTSSGENVISSMEKYFGDLLFNFSIQRNYYLARQKDFETFSQSKMTEKAAVTYLNLANNLLDKDQ